MSEIHRFKSNPEGDMKKPNSESNVEGNLEILISNPESRVCINNILDGMEYEDKEGNNGPNDSARKILDLIKKIEESPLADKIYTFDDEDTNSFIFLKRNQVIEDSKVELVMGNNLDELIDYNSFKEYLEIIADKKTDEKKSWSRTKR